MKANLSSPCISSIKTSVSLGAARRSCKASVSTAPTSFLSTRTVAFMLRYSRWTRLLPCRGSRVNLRRLRRPSRPESYALYTPPYKVLRCAPTARIARGSRVPVRPARPWGFGVRETLTASRASAASRDGDAQPVVNLQRIGILDVQHPAWAIGFRFGRRVQDERTHGDDAA
jgi:hypothetical protein